MPCANEKIQVIIDDAIKLHILWKRHLAIALEQHSSCLSPEHASRDDLCALGKWLRSPSIPDTWILSDRYRHTMDMHKSFHQCASKVLGFAVRAASWSPNELEPLLVNYENASCDLINALEALKKIAGTIETPTS